MTDHQLLPWEGGKQPRPVIFELGQTLWQKINILIDIASDEPNGDDKYLSHLKDMLHILIGMATEIKKYETRAASPSDVCAECAENEQKTEQVIDNNDKNGARKSSPSIPEGCKILPKEPTQGMTKRVHDFGLCSTSRAKEIYKIMLSASPSIPERSEGLVEGPKVWKPISEAPKDGKWVLGLWFHSGKPIYRLCAFNNHDYMQSWCQKPSNHAAPVRFWMPLPQPPQSQEGG